MQSWCSSEREARVQRCGGMVGQAPATVAMFEKLRRLAPEACPVLLLGETGTGKELSARALHDLSGRGPWVAVNCAAISESLALSELFGHERGAFTGASGLHRGAFERADGGTLFLDEVGELSPSLQAKLLRVLETREVQRVGGDRCLRSSFRLVAATHRDLAREVRRGNFRQDLYYRIQVATVRLPALRERLDDLPALVEALLRRDSGTGAALAPAALTRLRQHAWPGNVRELANVLQRARLNAAGGRVEVADLELDATPEATAWGDGDGWAEGPDLPYGAVRVLGRSLAEVERDALLLCLRAVGGSRAEAARRLGLPRQTLQDRLRRHGIGRAGAQA